MKTIIIKHHQLPIDQDPKPTFRKIIMNRAQPKTKPGTRLLGRIGFGRSKRTTMLLPAKHKSKGVDDDGKRIEIVQKRGHRCAKEN